MEKRKGVNKTWRTVIVASGEKLNINDNWLIVSSAEGESRVPVSDIYSLVIENRAAMLSVSVLTTLTQAGAHIILCDENIFRCLQHYQLTLITDHLM